MSDRNDSSVTVSSEWTLLEANSLPGLYTEVGIASFGEGREWRIGCALGGAHIYVFTDVPHPDEPRSRCIYLIAVSPLVEALASQLVAGKGEADA